MMWWLVGLWCIARGFRVCGGFWLVVGCLVVWLLGYNVVCWLLVFGVGVLAGVAVGG